MSFFSDVGIPQRNGTFCIVYDRRKFVMKHHEIVLCCIPHRRKTFPIPDIVRRMTNYIDQYMETTRGTSETKL